MFTGKAPFSTERSHYWQYEYHSEIQFDTLEYPLNLFKVPKENPLFLKTKIFLMSATIYWHTDIYECVVLYENVTHIVSCYYRLWLTKSQRLESLLINSQKGWLKKCINTNKIVSFFSSNAYVYSTFHVINYLDLSWRFKALLLKVILP